MNDQPWHDLFLDLLKERGYEDVEIWHHAAGGWTINYAEGEFDAPSVAIVRRRISELPQIEVAS